MISMRNGSNSELPASQEELGRLSSLTSWHSNWKGLRVIVLGAGISGFSVADTLCELGCSVLVVSRSVDEATREVLKVIGAQLVLHETENSVPLDLAAFAPDLVVVSPGFAPNHPIVAWSLEQHITVWGDVDLAWRLRDKVGRPAEWICVTGTNGKTTTVQLTTAMFVAGGVRAIACGNVGVPVLDALRDPVGFDVLVVELSSFQLHYLTRISPHSSVCLNIADDHLDWHGSAEAYRFAKGKVYGATKVACVFNQDDLITRDLVERADVVEGCRAIGFGLGSPGPSDFGVVGGILCDRAFLDDRMNSALEIATTAELSNVGLKGPHMISNVLAAAALARSYGISIESVRSAIIDFRPDHHRTESVANHNGVEWIDDSKATNSHAARASLSAYRSVVWILGGLFKGALPDDLISEVSDRLRGAVVIGKDRRAVLAAFARHAPELPIFEVDTLDTEEVMPAAVRWASQLAHSGDSVLLAPAAASMDQFTDYADRGVRFAKAVHELLGGEGIASESSSPINGA